MIYYHATPRDLDEFVDFSCFASDKESAIGYLQGNPGYLYVVSIPDSLNIAVRDDIEAAAEGRSFLEGRFLFEKIDDWRVRDKLQEQGFDALLVFDSDAVTIKSQLPVNQPKRSARLIRFRNHLYRCADFPSHPDTVMIEKTDLSGRDITEEEVWQHYDKFKNKILLQTKGRLTTIWLKVDGSIVQRNKAGEPIKIDTEEEFAKLNNGRMLEVHPEVGYEKDGQWVTDYIFCDLDPKDAFIWGDTKELAGLVYALLENDPNVTEAQIRYSGGRGFHMLGYLKKPWDVDEARAYMKEILAPLETDKIKLGLVREDDMLRMDTTLMKRRGSLRAFYSLNRNTGLVAIPVNIEALAGFKKEQARIEKVS
jgi:hypothetical protein